MSKRDEYVAKLKDQIDETNAMIDELEHKAADANAAAEKKYHEQIARLRAEVDEAADKLEQLRAAAEDRWEELVDSVEHVAKTLKQSFNYFKSQL
jgi:predicted nuclease with TOPRIM domain